MGVLINQRRVTPHWLGSYESIGPFLLVRARSIVSFCLITVSAKKLANIIREVVSFEPRYKRSRSADRAPVGRPVIVYVINGQKLRFANPATLAPSSVCPNRLSSYFTPPITSAIKLVLIAIFKRWLSAGTGTTGFMSAALSTWLTESVGAVRISQKPFSGILQFPTLLAGQIHGDIIPNLAIAEGF